MEGWEEGGGLAVEISLVAGSTNIAWVVYRPDCLCSISFRQLGDGVGGWGEADISIYMYVCYTFNYIYVRKH